VYGSPGTFHPPSMVASQNPNGFSGEPEPRNGASELFCIIGVSDGRVVAPPGLEHQHACSIHGQRVGRLAAAGTGADDDYVI
jgi:hypothetical protein